MQLMNPLSLNFQLVYILLPNYPMEVIATADEVKQLHEDLEEACEALVETGFLDHGLVLLRRLAQRSGALPAEHEVLTANRGTVFANLEAAAEPCHLCGERMVVREGPDRSFFWGCSTFPTCWAKRQLKAEERQQLGA